MKILFLNYEYPPLGGGASVATQAILSEWAREGVHEVHLVTSGLAPGVVKEHVGGKVTLHRLGIGKNTAKLHSQSVRDIIVYSLRAFLYAHGLIRTARKENSPFDVTIAFFGIPCGVLALTIKMLGGPRYIVALRGSDVPGFSRKYDTLYRFLAPLVRLVWREADAVIANSAGIRALALRTSPKQSITIIENGVDTDTFHPLESRKNDGPVVFLSTSRLTERKRIDSLILAFERAKKSTARSLELWLIGEGEEKRELQALADKHKLRDCVRFLGRVDHDNLASFYQKADVFVLPSKNEGMSNAVLEALASGMPLVVSGTGGMQELAVEGENGFFIDPDNVDHFAQVLLMIATDEGLRKRAGEKSRERALQKTWKKVADRFMEALELHQT